MSAGKENRIYAFDYMRVMAFFMIMLFHFWTDLKAKGVYDFRADMGFTYYNANMHMAKVAVSLFFLLSGGGLYLSSQKGTFSVRAFYRKHFLRLLIPFYITWLLSLLINYMNRTIDLDTAPGWTVLYSFFGMDTYAALYRPVITLGIGEWFLGALMILYALFPLLLFFMNRNKLRFMAVFTCIWIFLSAFGSFRVAVHQNVIIKVFDFTLGMFLASRLNHIKKWHALPAAAVLLTFLFYPAPIPIPDPFKICAQSLSVFLLCYSLENWLKKRNRLNAGVQLICSYSYEVFLIHHIIIYQFSAMISNHPLNTKQMLLLFFFESSVISVCAILIRRIEELTGTLFSNAAAMYKNRNNT